MANNALIGAVRAEATLEGGKFVSGAKKLRQEAKATETQFKKSFGAMGSAAKGFGGALVAGLGVGLLAQATSRALEYAGSLAEVAQQLGVTTKQLQVYRYAAGQVGVSQEKLEIGLSKLNISLGKAKLGAEEPAKAFGVLSKLIGRDIVSSSKQGGDALPLIADGLAKITDRSKRAAIEVALFGKSGAALDNLLSGGSKAINELSQAAEKLGIILSDEQIQRADETADKLRAVKTVLEAQIAGAVADNASSILSLAQALASLTGSIVKFLGSNPQAALAIIGGLAGSRFGLPGAAAGALGGFALGSRVAANARDANMDPAFRKQQAVAAFIARKQARTGASDPTGKVGFNPTVAAAAEKEYQRQIQLLVQARRAASRPKVTIAAGAAVPQFLAGGGRKGRTPRAPRDRSDDVAFQFDQELQRAHADVLRAQQGLARTSEERAAIALKLLDIDRQQQEAELNDRVRRAEQDFADGKITASALAQIKIQAGKLRSEYDDANALERKSIADDLAADKAHDAADLVQSGYDLRLEQLQNEASLAETASERREVELRILDLMKEQEKARLDAVIADNQASELAKAQAQQRLDSLDSIFAGRQASVIQGTRGPLEDWLAQLPTSAAKAQQAFEQLEAQGFDGLIDAAVALTDGFGSAKDALLNTLKQFLQGILRMQLQQGLGNLFKGGGIGNLFGSIFGGSSGNSGPVSLGSGSLPGPLSFSGNPLRPGFAHGGSFRVKGIPGIDRNKLMLNGLPIADVSYGERISVSNDNERGRMHGRRGDINFNLYGLTDGDSFMRNERQITRNARRQLGVNL